MDKHGDIGGGISSNFFPDFLFFRRDWGLGGLYVFPGNVGCGQCKAKLLGSAGCFVVVEFGGHGGQLEAF